MQLVKPTLQVYLQTAVNIKRLKQYGLYSKLEENIKDQWHTTDAKPIIWHISVSNGCQLHQIITHSMLWETSKEGNDFWCQQYVRFYHARI